MKTQTTSQNRPAIIAAVIAAILLLPFIAMQFNLSGVNWSLADFLVAGALLGSTGILLELAIRKFRNKLVRIVAIITLLFALLLIWAELAVGLFGTPIAGS